MIHGWKLKKHLKMIPGFRFDAGKCVGCKACSVACNIRNGWSVRTREVYFFNNEAIPSLPVFSISLACNHCNNPSCLDACPSSAFYRDQITGAVILDNDKCIGCHYCSWNCPYEAPRYDPVRRVMEKCNLCSDGLKDGRFPACVNACPTGALTFGKTDIDKNQPDILFVKDLRPSLSATNFQLKSPEIVPHRTVTGTLEEVRLKTEPSLTAFSFLSAVSVSVFCSSFLRGNFPGFLPLLLMLIAIFLSLFHPGRTERVWRSVSNFPHSPLSREIIALLLFTGFNTASVIFRIPSLIMAGCVTGLLLLLSVDVVYIRVDREMALHSGQTLISSLIMISFFSGNIIPFMFIAIVKFCFSVRNFKSDSSNKTRFTLRFLRLALLLIVMAQMISGIPGENILLAILLLAGELTDRILFYADFSPVTVMDLMNKNINRL